jgi:Tfp pilus assembly protein PilO
MDAKRLNRILLAGILLVIALGVAAFLYTDKMLASRSDEQAKLLAQQDAHQHKLDKLQTATNGNYELGEIEQLVDKILPSEKRQEDLIANIVYTATSKTGIPDSSITSISFSGDGNPGALSGATVSKEIPNIYFYPFTVTITELNYSTLLALFTELENNQRIIQVDQVQITPSKVDATILTSVTLSMKTFVKP